MAITELEALAGLRILVAIAKADGTIHENERAALTATLEGVQLPAGATVDSLVAEFSDLGRALGGVADRAARDDIYKSAFGMAYADGLCTQEEQALLDQIKKTWEIPDEQTMSVAFVFAETKDWGLPSNVQPIEDATTRATQIGQSVLKYSVLSALLGALGTTIGTDLASVAVQLKLVRDVGQYHGQRIDKDGARTLLRGLGLGGARMAMDNIVKLVPGWASALSPATSFAATFALGQVTNVYFGSGKTAGTASLAEEFVAAQREGHAAYAQHKASIDALEVQQRARLQQLTGDLNAGKLTLEEYARDVSTLV